MSTCHRALARLLGVDGLALLAAALLARNVDVAAPLDASWWAHATTADLAIVLGWWAAAVLAAWVALSALTCTIARLVPGLARLRALDRFTLPVVRRAVEAALACSVTVGVLAAPAGATTSPTRSNASAPPAVVQVMPDGRVVIAPAPPATPAPPTTPTTTSTHRRPTASSPSTTTTSTTTTATTATTTTTTAPLAPTRPPTTTTIAPPRTPGGRPAAPASPPRAAAHVVVAGDNLWRIAAGRLASAYGRPASDAEVVPYWRRVVDANRATLRSRDPNLIFPGELVTLPPV